MSCLSHIKPVDADNAQCNHKPYGECGEGCYLCEICGKMAWKKVEPEEDNQGCKYSCLCENNTCIRCGKHYPKPKEKVPTLLEEMDIKSGFKGELLPKDAFMRREVYRNVSEYLDKYMPRKE